MAIDPSPEASSKNLLEVASMSPSDSDTSQEVFGNDGTDIDLDPAPESLIIPRKSSSEDKDSLKEEDNIEDAQMQPAGNSSVHISTPPRQRRMSFELKKHDLLGLPLSSQGELEFGLLGDPNTHEPNPVSIRPRWSNANDDTELEIRKKIAKRKRIMGFLYGGNMPALRRDVSKYKDINVGSDYSPEKDQIEQKLITSIKGDTSEEMPSKDKDSSQKYSDKKKEEDKDDHARNQADNGEQPFSEQVFNKNSSINSKMSNRNNAGTARSQAQGISIDERATD